MGNGKKDIISLIEDWQAVGHQNQGRAELLLDDDGNLEAASLLRALSNIKLHSAGSHRYCCEFMEQQLTHSCPQHGPGKGCPDVAVFEGKHGQRYIEARNATYACIYCPHCGTKHEPSAIYHIEV